MNFEFCTFKDPENLSLAAAKLFVEQSVERDRFQVAISGGTTPILLFRLLASDYRDAIDWKKVHIFWCDERCVPPHDPASNYGRAREIFLSHVPVPESNVYRIKGELGPEQGAREYAATLKDCASPPLDFPRFDLVCLGLGEDGHTASLFPDSPVEVHVPVLPVTAHYQDRPAGRITLTQAVFNEARLIVFMAAGENKAVALARVLGGERDPGRYPAQRIKPGNGRLMWLVDEGAAKELPAEIKGN